MSYIFFNLFIDAALVDQNRTKLIQSVTLVMPIADELRQRGMIHPEIYNKIKAAGTSQDQMRELYNSLTTREVKSNFYKILKEIEPQTCESMFQLFGNYVYSA